MFVCVGPPTLSRLIKVESQQHWKSFCRCLRCHSRGTTRRRRALTDESPRSPPARPIIINQYMHRGQSQIRRVLASRGAGGVLVVSARKAPFLQHHGQRRSLLFLCACLHESRQQADSGFWLFRRLKHEVHFWTEQTETGIFNFLPNTHTHTRSRGLNVEITCFPLICFSHTACSMPLPSSPFILTTGSHHASDAVSASFWCVNW